MVDIIAFNASAAGQLERPDLSFAAISYIFLGAPETKVPFVRPDSPPWASFFIAREYRACEDSYSSLGRESQTIPHPRTGLLSYFEYSFVPEKYPTMTTPVFRVFRNESDEFCLAYCGLASRVSHIIVPSSNCVIYDLDRQSAQFVWEAYLASRPIPCDRSGRRDRIGILSMVTSYAHQAMNHLSGLQRLVDSGKCDAIDEVWVSGTEFFGKTEEIFPEIDTKIRRVDPLSAADRLSRGDIDIVKIGSNFVTRTLLERLSALPARQQYCSDALISRWPLLAVTVRSSGRRCLNLPDVVGRIVADLILIYPNLGVVLDGWVFPETSIIGESNVLTALLGHGFDRIREDALLCMDVAERLPPGALICNLVGSSVLESLRVLSQVDLYFSHVGTLQHKIAWFSKACGVVHGPTQELERMESSYYSCYDAIPPIFIGKESVVDVPSVNNLPSHYDYRIEDTSKVVCVLAGLLPSNGEHQPNSGIHHGCP